MKKFNLFKEIIIADKSSLLQATNSAKLFGININGDIIYEPFNDNEIFIYQGKPEIVEDFTKVLGKNYQVVDDKNRVLIKAFSNWQELISINTQRASYDDTTADGVAEFSNKKLEDIGWQITEFNLSYRTLVELLEEKCEGTILCIEQEEPYQFSGLGFLSDNPHAEKIMFEYCQNIAKEKLDNDEDFDKNDLDDDQEEAAKFFNCL
ncbi:MAG: hypothetical protein J7J96_00565 [Sulfurimonas sp.]|nr:hypothetical protein [Sulfurimonas sp.]